MEFGGGTLYLYPAYGKHYKSSEAMLVGWQGGMDFAGTHGYCSIRDLKHIRDMGYWQIMLLDRYACMSVGFPV
jgi:hypothetical protein